MTWNHPTPAINAGDAWASGTGSTASARLGGPGPFRLPPAVDRDRSKPGFVSLYQDSPCTASRIGSAAEYFCPLNTGCAAGELGRRIAVGFSQAPAPCFCAQRGRATPAATASAIPACGFTRCGANCSVTPKARKCPFRNSATVAWRRSHRLPVNTMVTGLAFRITWPVGASDPEPASTRNVTMVSPCSLAA